jgi:hypothetical protein
VVPVAQLAKVKAATVEGRFAAFQVAPPSDEVAATPLPDDPDPTARQYESDGQATSATVCNWTGSCESIRWPDGPKARTDDSRLTQQ